MYGSQKHKFLAKMLSQEPDFCDSVPAIDYDVDQSLDNDLKKKNKEELINVSKDRNSSGGKQPLVRIRSWSERHWDQSKLSQKCKLKSRDGCNGKIKGWKQGEQGSIQNEYVNINIL